METKQTLRTGQEKRIAELERENKELKSENIALKERKKILQEIANDFPKCHHCGQNLNI